MIELTSVLIIMLLFVFPLPVLVISLGLFTTWSLYRKSEAFNNQPSEGKKNLILSLVLFLVNIICSIILGVTLAFGIYYFIFDNFYLLIFNFLFCSAISLRWFDFTHNLYRHFIFKLKPFKTDAFAQSYFVVCQGFRERDHGGFGLAPVPMQEHLHWKIIKWSLIGCFEKKPFLLPISSMWRKRALRK